MENNNVIMDEVRPRKWLLVILIIVALIIVVVLANKIITDRKNRIKQEEEKTEEIFDKFSDSFDNFNDKKDEIEEEVEEKNKQFEINRFNSKFELYTGTRPGNAVSMLLDNVITNNKKEPNHIISVVYDGVIIKGETEIINLKKKLDVFADYEVLADYDENGYVMQIRIMD